MINVKTMMRRWIAMAVVSLLCCAAWAQTPAPGADTLTFSGKYVNRQYGVYIRMDAYHGGLTVPGQEVYGELPGYFGDDRDGRKWLFTDVELKGRHTALLTIINDYGSEDLTATFTRQKDGTYLLRQQEGSTIKIARDHKWVKMPQELVFVRE